MARQWFSTGAFWLEDGTEEYFGSGRFLVENSSSGSTASGTGTASGTSTVSGVGASTAASAGSASGSGSASGVGGSVAVATATAAGTSAVSGVGVAVAAATGTAAGSSTVSGVGSSSAQGEGTGTATGSCSVVGVGASTGSGVGSAAGSSSALGTMTAVAAAAGTATGSCTVIAVGASSGGSGVDIRYSIRARLLDFPDFVSTGAAVRPVFRPQADPLPCVVYRVDDETERHRLDGPDRVAMCDMEIAVIAEKTTDAVAVSRAIRGALHGWRGGSNGLYLIRAKQTGMRDAGQFQAEGSDEFYHLLLMDFRVRYRHD